MIKRGSAQVGADKFKKIKDLLKDETDVDVYNDVEDLLDEIKEEFEQSEGDYREKCDDFITLECEHTEMEEEFNKYIGLTTGIADFELVAKKLDKTLYPHLEYDRKQFRDLLIELHNNLHEANFIPELIEFYLLKKCNIVKRKNGIQSSYSESAKIPNQPLVQDREVA